MPGGMDMVRMIWEQITGDHPPDPPPEEIPREEPRLASAPSDAIRVTWIGHATFLVQVGGANLLTDPHLTLRASPLDWTGPERLVAPALTVEDLPEIHGVVLSHDHYDHLDRATVQALDRRFGERLRWFTPLGYQPWFSGLGVEGVTELDWDDTTGAPLGPSGTRVSLTALPAQHWTRRGLRSNTRLWASWALAFQTPAGGHRTVYFGGDSGYFPGYATRIRPYGPFELLLLPIGAYEPRWFMEYAHMNPEDALQAYLDLGGEGHFVGMHWGTFRLTFEPPLEPPIRMRRIWAETGMPAERLHLPGIGGTVLVE